MKAGVRFMIKQSIYSKKAKTTGLPVDEVISIAARSAYKAEKRATASAVVIYKTGKLPADIKWQVLSFLRVQWPEGFQGKNKLRDWITDEKLHPVSFVFTENGLVLSYVEVVWKNLEHCGKSYKTYGLTGVFTYPSFRKEGYGLTLVKTAKSYIEEQGDGDVVFFTSMTKGFYEKAGFIRMEQIKTLYGDKNALKTSLEIAYMLFLSDKGRRGRKDFETKPIYFGENTW